MTLRLPRLTPTRPSLVDRGRQAWAAAATATRIAAMWCYRMGPSQLIALWARRRIARGETIWLDGLALGGANAQTGPDTPRAHLAPNRPQARKKSPVMKLAAYPKPEYPFAYQRPPESGNVTNGLGEARPRRARTVFHSSDFQIPLSGLEHWYRVHASAAELNTFFRHSWHTRRADGPVSRTQWLARDPAEAAARVKNEARALGAGVVGITGIEDSDCHESYDNAYPTAISIALPMAREEVLHGPTKRSGVATLEGYIDVARIATALAERIRALGWEASACIDMNTSKILHVPIAVRAGLGQLGKHGSLITREHGSNVRLSTVLTTMPLAHDEPRDLGVDDFCQKCRVCLDNCPPGAIFPDKQLVRGQRKWYVDFDKCIPYFVHNHSCGICIQACPWSEPGRGALISAKTLERRRARAATKPESSPGRVVVPGEGFEPPTDRV